MILSIFNDFCNWWFLWWIAPFLLGLLLGSALWRGFKHRFEEVEAKYKKLKSEQYDLEKKIKVCEQARSEDAIKIKELEKLVNYN